VRGTKKRGLAPHWKVLDDPSVQRVAKRVARSIADDNRGILEVEDIEQECLMLIAGTPSLATRAATQEYGSLHHELRCDVLDKFVRPLMRSGEMEQRKYRTVTTEDADEETTPYVAFDDGSGDYTDEAVKLLLPAVWDQSYAYGLPQREDAPDADMPRVAGNKARANSHWAYIADIKTGWNRTPLSRDEKRALFMRYALAWTQQQIANHEGVNKSTINRRIDGAVTKITACLNGARIV